MEVPPFYGIKKIVKVINSVINKKLLFVALSLMLLASAVKMGGVQCRT